jgi:hypothetical protein
LEKCSKIASSWTWKRWNSEGLSGHIKKLHIQIFEVKFYFLGLLKIVATLPEIQLNRNWPKFYWNQSFCSSCFPGKRYQNRPATVINEPLNRRCTVTRWQLKCRLLLSRHFQTKNQPSTSWKVHLKIYKKKIQANQTESSSNNSSNPKQNWRKPERKPQAFVSRLSLTYW